MSISPPVQVFVTSGPNPQLLDGQLVGHRDDEVAIALQAPLEAGTRAILMVEGSEERIIAKVLRSRGSVVHFFAESSKKSERREWPRMYGSVPLRWRVASQGEAASWLDGSSTPTDGWMDPDDLMSFSVAGLAFDGPEGVEKGTTLLLELGVGRDPRRWRCLGKVVRVLPPLQADGTGVRLAVSLESVPADGAAALSELTLELQAAMM